MLSDIIKTILVDGKLPCYTWPGGYPLYYVVKDCAALCPECANEAYLANLCEDEEDSQWYLIGYDINWEDNSLYCEHCNKVIDSAYGNDKEE